MTRLQQIAEQQSLLPAQVAPTAPHDWHVPLVQVWPVGQPQVPFVQQPPPGHWLACLHVPSVSQHKPAC